MDAINLSDELLRHRQRNGAGVVIDSCLIVGGESLVFARTDVVGHRATGGLGIALLHGIKDRLMLAMGLRQHGLRVRLALRAELSAREVADDVASLLPPAAAARAG